MKIIAIDSSGLVATVAIATEDTVIAEYTVNYKKTHSQTLVPMLDEIKKMTELDLDTVDAVAVAAGPGSFTGLRIGSATAKGLALALDKPIIEVPTVDALAMNMWGTKDVICPIMDARRHQVYTGFYEFDNEDNLMILHEQFAEDIVKVTEMLNDIGSRFAPAHMNRQSAAALATLAVRYYKEGRIVNGADHKPEYLRMSQAEREMLVVDQKKDLITRDINTNHDRIRYTPRSGT